MQKRSIILPIVILLLTAGLFAVFTASNLGPFKRSSAYILPVPFSPQAPNENWDRNEDCEEASITMANAYLTGARVENLPPAEAQKSIDTLKAWENANIGYNEDTGSEATKAMAEGAFGLKVKKISNFTIEDLKGELLSGNPVLLPIDARKLNNPLYRNSGPQYHMIVIRGFENDVFIVNDPGTSKGKNNKYTFDMLKDAAADWNQKAQSMEPASKIFLVISK